ncbi:thioredoxin domain-containing protein [Nibricoccus aquaticus]|uniref:Thioredoxin domain-containing protein n=1 Tax=Nibricoccus aquaticus TaxID=2576891 RepID=A0A290Q5C4_9BACT|nr:thioredoxin domain-containing protein [Nibricoccus aquaticus]ATC63467.1 thioredoxin domain-containing protein [Nibricoccus aquaticus]
MANALAHEKSPYLLQHADNPVNWLPWGEAAFAKARAEQKPVFLSIGYSTCHWCHVMAHESFENAESAALLNESFVSIKVDREERPDVDRVYMHYVQAMTGHGGWPMSVWLTPELKPFFGGTYFPPEDRQGRAGFPAVLRAIAKGWRDEREKLVAESARVIELLKTRVSGEVEGAEKNAAADAGAAIDLTESGGEAFEKCFQYFFETFDAEKGGFGGAPKFPRASNLSFLFRVAAIQGPQSEAGVAAVKMATTTLRKMAEGGIRDHVGGGFHRYSVDDAWFVPHFEKMLYDQAQIAINYLDARVTTGQEIHAWVARDIFEYVKRELTSPLGGFYSAEDADSAPSGHAGGAKAHGVEGAFYVWTKEEIDAVCGPGSLLVCAHFGVIGSGNVPAQSDPHGDFGGKNVLMQRQALAATAQLCGLDVQTASDRLVTALGRLRDARAGRARPHLDDKIVTAWNGLMISALAKGAQVLGEREYAESAVKAAEFLRRELFDAERGVLYRSFRDGRGTTEGFAEDYAFLVQGLIDLYEATFEVRWLQWAEQLQGTMDALFWDEERGGYFNSAAGDANLVLRLKDDYDGAEPTAGSVAAMNLLRLAVVAKDGDAVRARGVRVIESLRGQWTQAPHALPQLLCAVELALEPARQVVIAGDPKSAEFRALSAVLHERAGARRSLLAANGGEGQRWLAERAPWMAEMKAEGRKATAYVCEHFTCRPPVTSVAELRSVLAAG